MKFAEKVKFFKLGEERAELLLSKFGVDSLEFGVTEYKRELIKYFLINKEIFYISIGFISRANEYINDYYRLLEN
nr:MAG TPA: hypothetical protein [Caudoviricetes sp.]